MNIIITLILLGLVLVLFINQDLTMDTMKATGNAVIELGKGVGHAVQNATLIKKQLGFHLNESNSTIEEEK